MSDRTFADGVAGGFLLAILLLIIITIVVFAVKDKIDRDKKNNDRLISLENKYENINSSIDLINDDLNERLNDIVNIYERLGKCEVFVSRMEGDGK